MAYIKIGPPKKLGEEYALGGFGIGLDTKLLTNLPPVDANVTDEQKAKFCSAVQSWLGKHPIAASVLKSPECGVCAECPAPTECPSCAEQGYLTPDECAAMKTGEAPAEKKGGAAWWWVLVVAGVSIGAGCCLAKMV